MSYIFMSSVKILAEQKALQAADFVSWAIFRKYEYNDDNYYNLIRGKIVEENPLFPLNNKAPFAIYEAPCGTPRTRTYLLNL